MLKKWMFGLILSIGCVFSVWPTVPGPSLTDVSKPICLTGQLQQFTLVLKSNPTTGFRWQLDSYDQRYLRLQGHEFQAPNTGLMGAPGMELFHFQLTKAALAKTVHGRIYLVYRRSWEKSGMRQGLVVRWCHIAAKANKEIG